MGLTDTQHYKSNWLKKTHTHTHKDLLLLYSK